jgi:hypothetical protein
VVWEAADVLVVVWAQVVPWRSVLVEDCWAERFSAQRWLMQGTMAIPMLITIMETTAGLEVMEAEETLVVGTWVEAILVVVTE